MNGWFLALIIVGVLNLGINLAKHGEPRNEKYSFISALVGFVIQIGITYMAIKTGM